MFWFKDLDTKKDFSVIELHTQELRLVNILFNYILIINDTTIF